MIMMGDRKKLVAGILGPPPEAKHEAKDEGPEALQAIAQELIDAVHAKDADGVAQAFEAAFLELESRPHPEAGEMMDGE